MKYAIRKSCIIGHGLPKGRWEGTYAEAEETVARLRRVSAGDPDTYEIVPVRELQAKIAYNKKGSSPPESDDQGSMQKGRGGRPANRRGPLRGAQFLKQKAQ